MKVLITNTVPPNILESLKGIAEVIQGPSGGKLMSRDDVIALAPQLDAIINQAELKVDEELLRLAPNLKIVANVAMGINNLDLDAMTKQGVWATNVPEAFTDSTADCTLGLILGLARHLHHADRYVRTDTWHIDGFQPGIWDGMLLSGKTLGIVGYGRIGMAVEARAKAFGMTVIFNNRSDQDHINYRSLDDLLQESDIVSLHTPLTPDTHHLISKQQLMQMKQGACLINMARGPVVDEVALVEVLESGHLKGAALDVFEDEPKVHPVLLTMQQVLLTPHIGGGTVESREQARQLSVDNVVAVLKGLAPLTPVNSL